MNDLPTKKKILLFFYLLPILMDSFVYKPIYRVCVRQGPKQNKFSGKEKSGKSASNEQN